MGGAWSQAGAQVALLVFLSEPFPTEGHTYSRQLPVNPKCLPGPAASHTATIKRRAGVCASFQRSNRVSPTPAPWAPGRLDGQVCETLWYCSANASSRSSFDSCVSQESSSRRRSAGSGDSSSGSATPPPTAVKPNRRRASKESTLGLIVET